MNQYDYVITKPPLDEDTLTHYGIKGMKWHYHKAKKRYEYQETQNKKKQLNRTSRKRKVTGKGSGGFKTGSSIDNNKFLNDKRLAAQLNNARTDSERMALLNAYFNSIGYNSKNVNNNLKVEGDHWIHDKDTGFSVNAGRETATLKNKDVDLFKNEVKKQADENYNIEKWGKKNVKKKKQGLSK